MCRVLLKRRFTAEIQTRDRLLHERFGPQCRLRLPPLPAKRKRKKAKVPRAYFVNERGLALAALGAGLCEVVHL